MEGGLSLGYSTSDGTATVADSDYLDNDGSLTFLGGAGEVKLITVLVNQDSKVESDEVFQVALGAITGLQAGINAANVTIANGLWNGVIRNDDSAQLILASVDNINTQQLEGDNASNAAEFQFSVTLDNPVPGGFTLQYFVRNGAITPGPNLGIAELGEDFFVDDSAGSNQFNPLTGIGTLTFTGTANERLFLDLPGLWGVGQQGTFQPTDLLPFVVVPNTPQVAGVLGVEYGPFQTHSTPRAGQSYSVRGISSDQSLTTAKLSHRRGLLDDLDAGLLVPAMPGAKPRSMARAFRPMMWPRPPTTAWALMPPRITIFRKAARWRLSAWADHSRPVC